MIGVEIDPTIGRLSITKTLMTVEGGAQLRGTIIVAQIIMSIAIATLIIMTIATAVRAVIRNTKIANPTEATLRTHHQLVATEGAIPETEVTRIDLDIVAMTTTTLTGLMVDILETLTILIIPETTTGVTQIGGAEALTDHHRHRGRQRGAIFTMTMVTDTTATTTNTTSINQRRDIDRDMTLGIGKLITEFVY